MRPWDPERGAVLLRLAVIALVAAVLSHVGDPHSLIGVPFRYLLPLSATVYILWSAEKALSPWLPIVIQNTLAKTTDLSSTHDSLQSRWEKDISHRLPPTIQTDLSKAVGSSRVQSTFEEMPIVRIALYVIVGIIVALGPDWLYLAGIGLLTFGLVLLMRQVVDVQSTHQVLDTWSQDIAAFEEGELDRWLRSPDWFPVRPSRQQTLTCVFGGSDVGWKAFTTTLGDSLLGMGQRLEILNLSTRRPAEWLTALSTHKGRTVDERTLPSEHDNVNLLEGVDWEALVNRIVEALDNTNRDHSADQGPGGTFQERQAYRARLREVCKVLRPDGPVSISRLHDALQVVLGEEVNLSASSPLTNTEKADLARLISEDRKQHTDIVERVQQLSDTLSSLVWIDPLPGTNVQSVADSQLRVVQVGEVVERLDNEIAVQMLFQLLLRTVQLRNAPADVIVIAGADRVGHHALESLHSYAEQHHLRVILLFDHLRKDSLHLLGTGGACAAFMALGNATEAKEASTFIGQEHKWVVNSLTKTRGKELSISRTDPLRGSITGIEFLDRLLMFNAPPLPPSTLTQSEGQSESEAVGRARVEEAVVEQSVIQGLPATGLILVEILEHGRRQIHNLDVNPLVASLDRSAPLSVSA